MRRLVVFAAVAMFVLAAAVQPAAADGQKITLPTVAVVSYEPATSGATGLTYDPELVPVGATATVVSIPSPLGTTTVLLARGLVPNREYGAHVHVKPCGPDPLAAGPHFQDEPDPVTPSTDPEYANPRNEIWLDFTTDELGLGYATSTVGWRFDGRPAGSMVIHEHHTHTGPGEAGTAGSRLACASVPFS